MVARHEQACGDNGIVGLAVAFGGIPTRRNAVNWRDVRRLSDGSAATSRLHSTYPTIRGPKERQRRHPANERSTEHRHAARPEIVKGAVVKPRRSCMIQVITPRNKNDHTLAGPCQQHPIGILQVHSLRFVVN